MEEETKCPQCGIEKTEENMGYDRREMAFDTHQGVAYPDIRFYFCRNCGHMYDIDCDL